MLIELDNHVFVNTDHILAIEPYREDLWIVYFDGDAITVDNQLYVTKVNKDKIVEAMQQTGGRW